MSSLKSILSLTTSRTVYFGRTIRFTWSIAMVGLANMLFEALPSRVKLLAKGRTTTTITTMTTMTAINDSRFCLRRSSSSSSSTNSTSCKISNVGGSSSKRGVINVSVPIIENDTGCRFSCDSFLKIPRSLSRPKQRRQQQLVTLKSWLHCLGQGSQEHVVSERFRDNQIRLIEILIDPKRASTFTGDENELKEERRRNVKRKEERSSRPQRSWKAASRFIDRSRIRVRGGSGGKGSLSSHQILSSKKSGSKLKPDGGHGGHGGCVYILADMKQQHESLRRSKSHFMAESGSNGTSQARHGRNGNNLIIRVPPGVVVRRILDRDGDGEFDDMNSDGEDEDDDEDDDDEDDNDDNHGQPQSRHSRPSRSSRPSLQAVRPSHDEETDFDSDYDSDSDHDKDNHSVYNNHDDDGGVEYFIMTDEELKRSEEAVPSKAKIGISSNSEWCTMDDNNDLDLDLDSEPDKDDRDQNKDEQVASPPTRQTVVLADLDKHGSYVLVAKGGRGGVGTIKYSSRHGPLPDARFLIQAAQPTPGEVVHLELEYRSIADVGLVGYPNAGKSSLLRAISSASPEVAPYPFTTLHPILGVVSYRDGFSVRVADIPGIIDGASIGRGMGTDFLRHIQRTNALLYIVDVALGSIERPGSSAATDLYVLAKELEAYSPSLLLDRQAIVVANKVDLLLPRNTTSHPTLQQHQQLDQHQLRLAELLQEITDAATAIGLNFNGTTYGISAGVTGTGLQHLVQEIRNVVIASNNGDNHHTQL